ncbi:MAG TPA: iron uptake protein [Limnobacter sp.]|nr:iron uptake protein [Limnobacter sp.]
MRTAHADTAFAVALRICAAVFGGYAFTWGFTAFGIAGLVALGVDFHEAETGVLMLSFLVFLVVFLWAFAQGSVARVCLVLAGGGALMTLCAWALQHTMLV